MSRHYLLISPYFPPAALVGAKRALNLVRHLPQLGWQPVVLAAPPLDAPQDDDLLATVPEGTPVSYGFVGRLRRLAHSRAASRPVPRKELPLRRPTLLGWDRQYLTPFDRFIVDVPAAVREGLKLIRHHNLQAIQVSADPWSGLLVGRILAQCTGLPLVPDLRDPWSAHDGKMALRPPPARALLRHVERQVFQHAAVVVLNTQDCLERYRELYAGRIPAERFVCIRNAFDETLFHTADVEPAAVPTLLHFGKFRVLVDPDALLHGFKRLVDERGLRPTDVRYRFVGGLRPQDRLLCEQLGLSSYVDEEPPVSYRDALPVLASAHLLTMVVPPDYQLQVPAKLYDYMAANRPILAVSANAEVGRMLAEAGVGEAVLFGDVESVAGAMGRAIEVPYQPACDALPPTLERFSARAQARAFADLLERVTS